MPIYDIMCNACRASGEVLVPNATSPLICPACGSTDTTRLMSATSALTGRERKTVPGAGDTTCCGHTPSSAGCAGPGSCCGQRG